MHSRGRGGRGRSGRGFAHPGRTNQGGSSSVAASRDAVQPQASAEAKCSDRTSLRLQQVLAVPAVASSMAR